MESRDVIDRVLLIWLQSSDIDDVKLGLRDIVIIISISHLSEFL